MAPTERVNPERLLQDADKALYRSKQAGRGTWRLFDPTIEADADANASVEASR
jgi:predicted signal transduction protein with EAL and GGDEF domain